MIDFSRTSDALDVFDAAAAKLLQNITTTASNLERLGGLDALDRMADEVRRAFLEDTRDVNTWETVRRLGIGFRNPPRGLQQTFIRRTVAEWKKSQAAPVQ